MLPRQKAAFVAFSVIMLGQTRHPLLPPDSLAIQMALLEAMGLPWDENLCLWLLRSLAGPFISSVVLWFSRLLVKKGLECIAFRKAFIQQQVQHFLQEHVNSNPQVLILAAGYDTLSLRLSSVYPNVPFWEIDHPATGNFKNKIWDKDPANNVPLRILGGKPANLHHACVDLVQKNSLAETLATLAKEGNNYSMTSPTIVVMEGLSMYLTTEQIKSLFDNVSNAVGPQSVVTFDMVPTRYVDNQQQPEIPKFITPLLLLYLTFRTEPWFLGLDTKILKEIIAEPGSKWSMVKEVESFGTADLAAIRLK
jgi:methyltransferase (TIGR00027 family)